jgi:hypothetical protein
MTVIELIERLRVEDPDAKVEITGYYNEGGGLFVGDKEIFAS